MEHNRWETAIRRLEVAVRPGARDDEILAAIDGFRHTADGTPLSQVCIEFACGGVPLAVMAQMKESLERLSRDNRELRQRQAADEAARARVEVRLDAAYRRVHELTQQVLAAQRAAAAAEPEFADGSGSGKLSAGGARSGQPVDA